MGALIDNTTLAGASRLVVDDSRAQEFWSRFPDHQSVDHSSFLDFITAIVLFRDIYVTGDSKAQTQANRTVRELVARGRSQWVEDTVSELAVLAPGFDSVVSRLDLFEEAGLAVYSEESAIAAVLLTPGLHCPKLPSVYGTTHVRWGALKGQMPSASDSQVALALFLQRGLFLRQQARKRNLVYMPYLYRGELLGAIDPIWCLRRPYDEFQVATLGPVPEDNGPLVALNTLYREAFEKVVWVHEEVPIQAIAQGLFDLADQDYRTCLKLALARRSDGGLQEQWSRLAAAYSQGPASYTNSLTEIKAALADAASAVAPVQGPTSGAAWQIFTTRAKPGVADSLRHLVRKLWPRSVPSGVSDFVGDLVAGNALQLLFRSHVDRVRARQGNRT